MRGTAYKSYIVEVKAFFFFFHQYKDLSQRCQSYLDDLALGLKGVKVTLTSLMCFINLDMSLDLFTVQSG